MPLYIAKSGDLDRCTDAWLTHWQSLKYSATQLLIKYKSGALVTQYCVIWWDMKPLSHFNNLQKVSPRNVWSRPLAPTPGPGKPNAYFALSLSAWLVSNYFPAKVFANCLLMRILYKSSYIFSYHRLVHFVKDSHSANISLDFKTSQELRSNTV